MDYNSHDAHHCTNVASTTLVENHVLRKYIGLFVVVYFDDILVYSKTFDDHVKHLRVVFETLQDSKLYGKLTKCRVSWIYYL